MCITRISTAGVEDVKQNGEPRVTLHTRLSLGDQKEASASNFSVIENSQEERPLSRSVVLERGVHYAEVLPIY